MACRSLGDPSAPQMPIRNRREMAQALEEVMSHAYSQLEERQRLEAESSLLKTYLLEAHSSSGTHEDTLTLLRSAFGQQRLGARAEGQIHESEEETFFTVEISYGRDRASFYVDATDARYWVLHSTSKSTPSDRILQRVVLHDPNLDSVWLPMQLLEDVTQLGSFRGLGLDYDRREVPDVDFEAPDAPVEFLKMQLWGNRAREILRVLRQHGAFPESTTLSKVKVKHWLDREADADAFSLSDVKYDGKITARGTSFQAHIGLVSTIVRDYSRNIRDFEDRFALHFEVNNQGRGRLFGEPLGVVFSHPVQNMEVFLESVFSGAAPFRLSGVPVKLRGQLYRVTAVDLHVSQPVIFEVAPEFMRVYLPQGSCGNTIARLYTNLQHYYDSLVELRTGDGERVFES
jgi:hypothetical protein